MSKLSSVSKRTGEFVSKNSPSILTGLGVGGVVTTALFSAKAGYRHGVSEAVGGVSEDPKQRLKESYKFYIPATAATVTTVAAILSANSISSKRNAAIVSLYSITDSAFKEYKKKVVETLGEEKEGDLKDKLAKEAVSKNPPPNDVQVIVGTGEVLTYDSLTGRYFMCDIETIRKAQNDINAKCINEMYASQNDFYRLIGLNPTTFGEEVGWTADKRMEIHFTSTLTEQGKPCLVINYQMEPTRGFHKFGGW